MKASISIFALAAVLLSLNSCANKNMKEFVTPQESAPVITKPVSFATDIKPFIATTCRNCHVNRNKLEDPSSYSVFKKLATTKFRPTDADPKILVAFTDNNYVGRMPEDGPPFFDESSLQVTTIRKWIQDGMPE